MTNNSVNIITKAGDLHSKIFEKARNLFYTQGVRNTTMNDIAKELGISKKTLYKEFSTKAELVSFCVNYDLKKNQKIIENIIATTENAIEELLLIGIHRRQELQFYHPTIMHDIQRFFPKCWSQINNHLDVIAKQQIADNLNKGIKQGYYRKNISIDITTFIQLHLGFLPLQQTNSPFKPSEIYSEVLKYNIYAITTPVGIAHFEELIKKYKI